MARATEIKALFFDVFGTLVDWRGGGASQAEASLAPRGFALDWLAFADAWRGEYQTGMEEVRSGLIPFSRLDILHRRNLDRILPQFGLEGVPEPVLHDLNLAWHRLDAWPDATEGQARLRARFLLAPYQTAISPFWSIFPAATDFSSTQSWAPSSPAIINRNRASISPRPRPSICRPKPA